MGYAEITRKVGRKTLYKMEVRTNRLRLFFPGQGSQNPYWLLPKQMLRDSIRSVDAAIKTIKGAIGEEKLDELTTKSESANHSLEDIQLAVFIRSYLSFLIWVHDNKHNMHKEHDNMVGVGFSLGEITALTAAKAISLTDALEMIELRSSVIQMAQEHRPSQMYFVSGFKADTLRRIFGVIEEEIQEQIFISIYINERSFMISATPKGVTLLKTYIKAQNPTAVFYPIALTPGFHSKHMDFAKDAYDKYVKQLQLYEPIFPVYSNAEGKLIETRIQARQSLKNLLTEPARWSTIINKEFDLELSQPPHHLRGLKHMLEKNCVEFSSGNHQISYLIKNFHPHLFDYFKIL